MDVAVYDVQVGHMVARKWFSCGIAEIPNVTHFLNSKDLLFQLRNGKLRPVRQAEDTLAYLGGDFIKAEFY